STKPTKQLSLFKDVLRFFSDDLLIHMCNTGGFIRLADVHFNMVRWGIGMYGFAPGDLNIVGLQPAMKWITYLAQVRPVKKGDCVSYGSNWQSPADGYLGVIPVGFSDG